MRFLLVMIALATAWTAKAQGTFEAVVGYNNNAVIRTFSGTAGWTFQATNFISVTELGCLANFFPGNNTTNPIQVGLWAPSGVLLASSSITPASTLFNQSLYESVAPVLLNPGQTYHIGAYFPEGLFSLDAAIPSFGGSVTNSAEIRLLGAALRDGGFASPLPDPGTEGGAYLGPNLRYRGDIPEPASAALLGLGALLLAACRKSRPL